MEYQETTDADAAGKRALAGVVNALHGKPHGRLECVALRAALRVLPLTAGLSSYSALDNSKLLPVYTNVFRAGHCTWSYLRYPLSIKEERLHAGARSLSRLVDEAATKAGDTKYSKAADALVDAALAVARADSEFAYRSLVNSLQASSFANDQFAETTWLEILADVQRLTNPDLGTFDPVQLLLSQRLWRSTRPQLHRLWTSRLFGLLESVGSQAFWKEWYEARQRGLIEYNADILTARDINVAVSNESNGFWKQPLHDIAIDLNEISSSALERSHSSAKTIAEFALSVVEESDTPLTISDITQEFSRSNFPVVAKTLRGELSRLASSGRIKRIRTGTYSRNSSSSAVFAPEVEPQTKGAIQFEAKRGEPIRVKKRGSTGNLRTDDASRKRHAEVCRRIDNIIQSIDRDTFGANTASAIVNDVLLFKESVSEAIEGVDPDLMIPRGDGLRKDVDAYENKDDMSRLPPISDGLLLGLKKLVAAYNNFVVFDPELVVRDEALLGPDARKALVPPHDGQRVIVDAVARRAAVAEVAEILAEDADLAPEVPDPENRLSRRYSEGVKNFSRIAVEKAIEFAQFVWAQKLSIATGAGAGLAAGVGAAKWVLANEAWLLRYFAGNEPMIEVIKSVVNFLAKLPLA